MKFYFKIIVFIFAICLSACKKDKPKIDKEPAKKESSTLTTETEYDFIVSFGSCNKQYEPQSFWKAIMDQNPDIFIWGGDNIYSDTEDMTILEANYQKQLNNPEYKAFLSQLNNKVYGIWDDHDYAKNDGGEEWVFKNESQKLFLNFMGVDSLDARRNQEGIYNSETIDIGDVSLKLITLDTRYFRSPLQKDNTGNKRYIPWQNGEGTVLGKDQWEWFENELKTSTADYHIIVSSIQIWSDEHGFETWGNFPHEVNKLKTLLNTYQPNNVVMLSGDRHISEFSSQQLENFDYPVFDFTSSGLTHVYSDFTSEPNADRVGEVIAKESFGLLKYDFENNSVLMEMQNEEGVLQSFKLVF
jgi:alkaline phosphatase D